MNGEICLKDIKDFFYKRGFNVCEDINFNGEEIFYFSNPITKQRINLNIEFA